MPDPPMCNASSGICQAAGYLISQDIGLRYRSRLGDLAFCEPFSESLSFKAHRCVGAVKRMVFGHRLAIEFREPRSVYPSAMRSRSSR